MNAASTTTKIHTGDDALALLDEICDGLTDAEIELALDRPDDWGTKLEGAARDNTKAHLKRAQRCIAESKSSRFAVVRATAREQADHLIRAYA